LGLASASLARRPPNHPTHHLRAVCFLSPLEENDINARRKSETNAGSGSEPR
jgi:hypothetical protein